jgi:hypothetical protein
MRPLTAIFPLSRARCEQCREFAAGIQVDAFGEFGERA